MNDIVIFMICTLYVFVWMIFVIEYYVVMISEYVLREIFDVCEYMMICEIYDMIWYVWYDVNDDFGVINGEYDWF